MDVKAGDIIQDTRWPEPVERVSPVFLLTCTLRKFADEKKMRLKHRLKKLSAGQKRLKIENLAKNDLHRPLAYVYVEILVIP
jgi:hypothetical protein